MLMWTQMENCNFKQTFGAGWLISKEIVLIYIVEGKGEGNGGRI